MKIIATHDVPFFNRSLYDGYAIRSENTKDAKGNNPIDFEVIDEIGAGRVFDRTVGDNQAVRIMTGAQIPEGTDCVIMLEHVKEIRADEKHIIKVKHGMKPGENISFIGEDIKKGTVLAPKGSYINPGITALLATFGYKQVPVGKKPTMGVIATGSELLDVDEPLQPGKIRNSNTYMSFPKLKEQEETQFISANSVTTLKHVLNK